MEPKRGKLLYGTNSPSLEETSRPDGSHVVTLTPGLGFLENPVSLSEYISTEYNLTASVPNSSLSIRDLSLLLEVLSFHIVHYGANFSMILALTELSLRISGGRKEHEISDSKIRQTVSVSQIILKELHDSQFSLYSGDFVAVRSEIKELLMPYLMSKRTYGSRFRHWRPEKFIKIKAVPVSILYERTPHKTERYSGYTKGYGESHGNAHKFKTKPNFELDGLDVPDKETRNLILRVSSPEHQNSNQLWIKYRNLAKEN